MLAVRSNSVNGRALPRCVARSAAGRYRDADSARERLESRGDCRKLGYRGDPPRHRSHTSNTTRQPLAADSDLRGTASRHFLSRFEACPSCNARRMQAHRCEKRGCFLKPGHSGRVPQSTPLHRVRRPSLRRHRAQRLPGSHRKACQALHRVASALHVVWQPSSSKSCTLTRLFLSNSLAPVS